jgi:hypothetical protein
MLRSALFILLLPLHLTSAQAGQVPVRPQDTLRIAQTFRATVVSVDTTRIVLTAPTPTGRLDVQLAPQVLRRLAPLRGRTFTARAEERPTPGGVRAAVLLREGTTLRAVAETIRDLQILRPAERDGILVELRPAQNRKLLYENDCRTVYNVPTAFTISGQQFVLQAYESQTVRVGGTSYTISLAASQFVVPKQCPVVFEGSRSLIEYAIVRNAG